MQCFESFAISIDIASFSYALLIKPNKPPQCYGFLNKIYYCTFSHYHQTQSDFRIMFDKLLIEVFTDSQPTTRCHSLMPFETPILRIGRAVAACQRCRNAKTRCDGKLPSCTACEKVGKADACVSANGPERSYVATLESHISKLNKSIDHAKAKRCSTSNFNNSAAVSASQERENVNRSDFRSARAAQEKEASDIDNLAGDFGLL